MQWKLDKKTTQLILINYGDYSCFPVKAVEFGWFQGAHKVKRQHAEMASAKLGKRFFFSFYQSPQLVPFPPFKNHYTLKFYTLSFQYLIYRSDRF